MLIVDEPTAQTQRDLTEYSLSALVINPSYNMVPCRGRGRLLGSKGPLYLMRAPVPEDKRSTFTSRGHSTGYTINPRIGSTSTRLADLRLPVSVRAEKHAQYAMNDSKGRRLTLDMRLLCLKGGYISHGGCQEMSMYITRDHMSRKS